MDVKQWALDQLKHKEINSDILKRLIDGNENRAKELKEEYHAYTGESLDIQRRTFKDPNKINNKLENDYRGEIVDQMVGYLFGNPVTYQIDEQAYENKEEAYNEFRRYFENFRILNTVDDLDSETGEYMGASGVAYRLAYVDTSGQIRIMNLPPWEVITLDTQDETPYALWYYPITRNGNQYIRVEWYDETHVTFFISDGEGYKLDPEEEKKLHTFDYTPIIKFENNRQGHSDFRKTATLIDAYNRLVSDAQNELEEFRQAYMYYKGVHIEEEELKKARQVGGFEIDENGEIGFITKQINDVFLENQKKTLKDNIYRFAKRVDMSDEKFSGGTQTGESRKWKLLALENDAIKKERSFGKSLRYQFKVLASAWAKMGYDVDYLNIYWQFDRNIPIELIHESDILVKLKGVVSDKTRLALASFVDDPEWEIEQMKQEGDIDLDHFAVVEEVEGDE